MFRELMVAGCLLSLGACATTLNEPDTKTPPSAEVKDVPERGAPALDSVEAVDNAAIVDGGASATTIALTGAVVDLLPEMSIEISRLGSQVAEGGDDNTTLARIEQIWERIRPEIERDRPKLLNGLGAAIVMARTAVERTRPADADKAFSLLTDLVDQFTNDV